MATPYNYEHFTPEVMTAPEFEAFRDGPRVQTKAPDGSILDLRTGERIELSSLWKRGHLVMEFGSIT